MAKARDARGPTGPMRRLTARGVEGALFRYQVMANIVGTLIIPLFVFTGFKIFAGDGKLEVEIFGVAHGYLYIVYLITVGVLSFKTRLNIVWILLMCGAGLVPGMTFLVEWWVVTRKIHPLLAPDADTETAASPH
jgi:integral membrane protein